MKLKEYVDALNEFVKENPDALEMDVYSSKDDEGNGYNAVHYTPTIGIYDDGDFIPKDQVAENEREESEINAVCIN